MTTIVYTNGIHMYSKSIPNGIVRGMIKYLEYNNYTVLKGV